MSDWRKIGMQHASAWGRRALEFGRSRRARKIGIGAAVTIVLLGAIAYFAVPMVLHNLLVGQVARQLKRPVSVGRIGFNLYTLKLDIDQLHIGEPEGSQPFVDVGHIRVRVGWTSLFRFAPVIKEVSITKPSIHVVREAEQRFNFSDLLESPNPPPAPPKKEAAGKPLRFAVSNIRLIDGDIRFDDQVLAQQHRIEHIQLGIPFIANLPGDVDIYVQPLLQMVIDGSLCASPDAPNRSRTRPSRWWICGCIGSNCSATSDTPRSESRSKFRPARFHRTCRCTSSMPAARARGRKSR